MSDNNENVDQDKTPEGPLQTDHGMGLGWCC